MRVQWRGTRRHYSGANVSSLWVFRISKIQNARKKSWRKFWCCPPTKVKRLVEFHVKASSLGGLLPTLWKIHPGRERERRAQGCKPIIPPKQTRSCNCKQQVLFLSLFLAFFILFFFTGPNLSSISSRQHQPPSGMESRVF